MNEGRVGKTHACLQPTNYIFNEVMGLRPNRGLTWYRNHQLLRTLDCLVGVALNLHTHFVCQPFL